MVQFYELLYIAIIAFTYLVIDAKHNPSKHSYKKCYIMQLRSDIESWQNQWYMT